MANFLLVKISVYTIALAILHDCTWSAQLFLFHIQKLKHFSPPLTTTLLVSRQLASFPGFLSPFFVREYYTRKFACEQVVLL